MSTTKATTTTTTPNHNELSPGISDTKTIPKPRPNSPCVIACGVKHAFIFASILFHLLLETLNEPTESLEFLTSACTRSLSRIRIELKRRKARVGGLTSHH